MDWHTALRRPLLGDNTAEKQLGRFLVEQMPAFEAPTNVRSWRRERRSLQKEALAKIYLRGYSRKLIDSKPKVVWGPTLRPDKSYVIRKLRYEAYPDYWIPALLYQPARMSGRVPVVLNPNGHHSGGKAAIYKQARCANLARRGVIALSTEFAGMGELEADRQHNNIAFVDLTGMAGVGLFYLALKKALDVLLAHRNADPKRVGCTGLSGGGWQTIVISALDDRITLSVPVAGYTSVRARVGCIKDIGDLEQTPVDLTSVLDYQDMTALLAPRPTLLITNANDECCFRTDRAKPVIFDAVVPTYRAFGAEDRFQFYSNTDPGTHNYDADNRSRLYRFINEQWGLDSPTHDLHRPDELLSEEALNVGLPPVQETVRSIALRRGRQLVSTLRIPGTAAARGKLRRQLAQLIRLPKYEVSSATGFPAPGISGQVLSLGPWALPANFLLHPSTSETELVAIDHGRSAGPAELPAGASNRVVIDLLGTGEYRSDPRYQMLIDTTGHRLLGIRVAQLLAVARYLKARTSADKLDLIGDGPVCAFTCMLVAALEPGLFKTLTLQANVKSILGLIEWGQTYESIQLVMCFGLLEVADVPQVQALLEGIALRQPGRVVPVSSGAARVPIGRHKNARR